VAGEDLEARRRLTFGQAQGLEPLPRQLNKTEMPRRLRAKLWELFDLLIEENKHYDRNLGYTTVFADLFQVLLRHHVDIKGDFADTFRKAFREIKNDIREIFHSGTYIEIFNFLEHFLKSGFAQPVISQHVDRILGEELSAYRVCDGDLIAPVGSDIDRENIQQALHATRDSGAQGARAHLRRAIEYLNEAQFSDSVRESISAVESVAKVLASDPKTELAGALKILEKSSNIHGGMRAAFNSLYGYTSDEKGIRHSLLFKDKADVDETDALFMVSACSAFVTYLVSRARLAGITVSDQS